MVSVVLPQSAVAEPSRESDTEAENPLLTVLREMGDRWGVAFDAERIAFNPIQRAIIVRGLRITSQPQGNLVNIERTVLQMRSKSSAVDSVSVTGAVLRIDVAQDLGLKSVTPEKMLGRAKNALIQAGAINVSWAKQPLFRLSKINALTRSLMLSAGPQGAEVSGSFDVESGQLDFEDFIGTVPLSAFKGRFEKRNIVIDSLMFDADPGRVQCNGSLPLAGSGELTKHRLTCDLDTFPLRHEGQVELLVSGPVELKRTKTGFRAEGALKVVGGKAVEIGRWGPRRVDSAPFEVDLELNLAAARHKARLQYSRRGESLSVRSIGRRISSSQLDALLAQIESEREPGQDSGAEGEASR